MPKLWTILVAGSLVLTALATIGLVVTGDREHLAAPAKLAEGWVDPPAKGFTTRQDVTGATYRIQPDPSDAGAR